MSQGIGHHANQPGQEEALGIYRRLAKAHPAIFGRNLLITVRNCNKLTKEDYKDQ